MKIRSLAVLASMCVAVAVPVFGQAVDGAAANSTVAEAQPAPAADSAEAASPVPAPISAPVPAPRAIAELPDWPPAAAAAPSPVPAPNPDFFARFREDIEKPLTVGGKFKRSIKDTIFTGIPSSAVTAGFSMATDSHLERDYGMGFDGFVRRWGSAFGTRAVTAFVGDFALASAMHQDPRYHPDKHKNFFHRAYHAIEAVFVCQSDDGQRQFNASKLFGITAAAGASTGWHHSSDQGVDLFGERVGYGAMSAAIFNGIAEFIFWRHYDRH